MAFDLARWKEKLAEQLAGWWSRAEHAGATSVYAGLSAATLWPLVEAARKGELTPVILALGAVTSGVGANLIAEQVQRWKDRTRADEAKFATWIEQRVGQDIDFRNALDEILQRLQAVETAQAGLGERDRRTFGEALRADLERLGNLPRFQATLSGSGAIAQGDRSVAAGAGGLAIAGDARESMIVSHSGTGHVIFAADVSTLWRAISKKVPREELRQATSRYLEHIVDRYQYLDFKGMGVSDRVALKLPLLEMYVPLKARAELPERDTWDRLGRRRGVRVSGRSLLPEERRGWVGDWASRSLCWISSGSTMG